MAGYKLRHAHSGENTQASPHLRLVPPPRPPRAAEIEGVPIAHPFPLMLPDKAPNRRQRFADRARTIWRRGTSVPTAIGAAALTALSGAERYHPEHRRKRNRLAAVATGVVAMAGAYAALRYGFGHNAGKHVQALHEHVNHPAVATPNTAPLPYTDTPHLSDMVPYPTPPPLPVPANVPVHTLTGQIDYSTPWAWSAERFGPDQAMTELRSLGDVALRNGHQVSWLQGGTLPDGSTAQILMIDHSTGQHVIDVLAQSAA